MPANQNGGLVWQGQVRRRVQQLPPPGNNATPYQPSFLPQPGGLVWQGQVRRRVQKIPPANGIPPVPLPAAILQPLTTTAVLDGAAW